MDFLHRTIRLTIDLQLRYGVNNRFEYDHKIKYLILNDLQMLAIGKIQLQVYEWRQVLMLTTDMCFSDSI